MPMSMASKWKTVLVVLAIVLTANFMIMESVAWARAGGGGSSGSRGGRSFSQPARPTSPSPGPGSQPSAPYGQPSPGMRPGMAQPPPSSFMRSPFAQGLAGGLLGGFVGNMLFGSRGYSAPYGAPGAAAPGSGGFGGSGIGLFDLLLIGGGIYFLMRYLRRRRERMATEPSYYAPADFDQAGGYGGYNQAPEDAYDQPPISAQARDLQQGLEQIRSFDPGFNEYQFKETAQDLFFRIQAAWMNRSLEGMEGILTDEMAADFAIQFAEMKSKGQINRLENIAVRKVEFSEAWQESGQDYITVLFTASLLDYTVDDKSGEVVAGDRHSPVKFEEFWTFCRPSGHPQWKLAAINQA
jgi:predicted lipid-binding transport protein (Tim44 family)